MKRDLSRLSNTPYDLVIVGGGIFGCCALWEAALRGLKAVLVEKNDFSHATSANHFKVAHCGIRYIQHGDIPRLRESSRERSALMRIAPHLVHTVPILIPTYGHGTKGKLFLGAGMTLYDLLTLDRNNGILEEKKIKKTRYLDTKKVLSLFPGLPSKGLTGGAVFEEGQMYNPPRLALSFVRAAVEKGADAANHLEAVGVIRKGGRILGLRARDTLTGEALDILCKMVLNTSGPWANQFIREKVGISIKPPPTFSRDLAFVIPRYFENEYGLAMATQTMDADSLVDRGGRHLFAMPWRDCTLIGVWHKVFHENADNLYVTDQELDGYCKEVNSAYPGICDGISSLSVVNMGLTLFGDEDRQESHKISFGKRSQIIDHSKTNKLHGIVTLIGVRATTARGMTSKAMDLICTKLSHKGERVDSRFIPIWGGDFLNSKDIVKGLKRDLGEGASEKTIDRLFRNYGTGYPRVLKYQQNDQENRFIPGSTVLKAEIAHAVLDEMALTLKDVVFRRTDLGTGKPLNDDALGVCSKIMGSLLNWDDNRRMHEMRQVKASYPRLG